MSKNDQETDERFETTVIKPMDTPWKTYKTFNKYDPTYPRILYEMLSDGKTVAQIARFLQCSKPTLLRWVEEIDDMKEAYEFGMTNFEAEFEDKIEKYMIHNDPDTAPAKVNKEMMEMYTRTNIKKFADLADKQQNQVTVKVDNNGLTENDVVGKIANIMSSVENIQNAKINKDKIQAMMQNKTQVEDVQYEEIKNDEIQPTDSTID